MRLWHRPRKQPPDDQPLGEPRHASSVTAEERADALADRADQLAMSQPGTRLAIEAAEQSVAVAEQLAAVPDPQDNRRRLARALWRRTSAYVMAEDFLTAAGSAQHCWGLCLQLLDGTSADAAAFDEMAGLVVKWCGALGPALAMAGRQQEADQMSAVIVDISARARGPRGRQVRARQALAELSGKAEAFKQADLDGRGDQIAGDLQEAIAVARHSVDVLRDHVAEGPYDVADLARMLRVLGRLCVVAGLIGDADAALDEAISAAGTVAGQGPIFAGLLRELQTERHGTPGPVPGAEEPPHGPLATVGKLAFLRAARDLGGHDADLFPGDAADMAAVIDRLRAREEDDPGRCGPLRGLAMAWHAHLLVGGRPAEARDLAGRAIRQLMRFSDAPDRIQAALTTALTVDAGARQAAGDHDGARLAWERAAAIRTILIRRDRTYADDLGSP
jgi:hypothetical protein